MTLLRIISPRWLAALLALTLVGHAHAETPVRHVESGMLQGKDGEVLSFLGIPYAAAPVGQRRWRAPEPAITWSGQRDSTAFGHDCIGEAWLRAGTRASGMDEDCLVLNVWEPRTKPKRGLPVMVWIYGGSFQGGSSAVPLFDGAALARQGAVVVSFNYRVGIFGFFAHPQLSSETPTHSSGNYGLLDAVAALRWVQRNIPAFGGDADRVTIFGESAGATLAAMLLVSPLSENLFSGAILQSPGLLRPLSTLEDSMKAGVGLGGDIAQLREMSAATLQARATASIPAERRLGQPRPFGPIVDGWAIPLSDTDAFARGAVYRVPLIIGSNADEGRLFTQNYPIKTVAQYRTFLRSNFGATARNVEQAYCAKRDEDVPSALSKLFGDSQFVRGVDIASGQMANRQPRTWRYRFDGPIGPGRLTPTHADDLAFVFGTLPEGSNANDTALSRQISAAWVNFAKYRDPNGPGLPFWETFGRNRQVMRFAEKSEMIHIENVKIPDTSVSENKTDACE